MAPSSLKRLGDWTFERVGGLCRLRGPHELAFAASAGASGSGLGGVDVMGDPDAAAPANASSQFMRLRFRSRGLFRAEPDAHFALGVAGAWRKADPSTSDSGNVSGRGLVIGNVSGAPNGCAHAPVVQVESFQRAGNALLHGTCSPRLEDDTWYFLSLTATTDAHVGYRLDDASGDPLAEIDVVDESDVPAGLGGWWILHAFSDRHLERDWCFDIADLEIGWR